MKAALQDCSDEGILPDFARKPPALYIYLPNEAHFLAQRGALAAEARRQFAELYPGSELKIKFRVIKTNINVTYIYSRVKELLQNLKRGLGSDIEARDYVEILERSNEEAYQQTTDALDVTASVARKIKYSAAGARFLVVAATRTLQTLPALAQGGAPMAAALTLVVGDAAVEYFNVAYTQKIQRFLSRFPFRSRFQVTNHLSRFANNSLGNLVLFSVGRPLVMQTVAHMADPDVPNPTVDSALNLFGWSSVGVLFYASFTNGYNTLRDKGWVSSSQIDMALQVSGVFDLATSILNSNPNWYFYRLFTWGPQWSFYALVALLAKVAPMRADKILAIESSIEDWQDVHEEQVTDASWHINTEEDFQEALAAIRRIEQRANECEEKLVSKILRPELMPGRTHHDSHED